MSLDFLYTAVSWVLLRWHQLFTLMGLSESSGLNWSLSIIFLVVTARVLLFRFFLKQVHYQRNMQALQPQLQEIRKKYKDDRQAQQRAMMELQQKEGFNPLAGCLPMVLQIPIFISLFHVLRHISNSHGLCLTDPTNAKLKLYSFAAQQTCSASDAKLFNGAPLAGSLRDSRAIIEGTTGNGLGGSYGTMLAVTIVRGVVSAAATCSTQRLVKAGNPTQPEGTAATVQKLMMFGIPVSVLISGIWFPLGVLLYWFTSNTWTMGQQLYINKFHPHVPKEAAPVGELGRTLAPKPGQKPTNRRTANTAGPADAGTANGTTPNGATANGAASSTASTPDAARGTPASGANARQATPRPGQRPNRSGGGRPTSKRPNQAKKRR